ncbi:MAG: hypothetical protein C0600_02980 [Ignavibacteria bacterium]|nr:MAG: hypothetical protein C0600_02980 [Ignavibacteria bacterium]
MRFRFTKDHIAYFSSGQAAEILHEYHSQTEKYSDSLRIQTALRAVFPALATDTLQACLAQFALQEKGRKKCALPENALYTQDALEMASSSAAARLHAALLPSDGVVLDIAAGIGSDAAQIAGSANGIICIEADAVHASILRHNLLVGGYSNAAVLQGRAESWLPLLKTGNLRAVFADPARRNDGKRHVEVELYSPPLTLFDTLPPDLPVLVKISPAADAPEGWNRATVAFGKECSEQLLHRNLDLPPLCALHADHDLRWTPDTSLPPVCIDTPRFLIEPHAAIIRTGAVEEYLREQRAAPLDPQIAYGLSEHEPPVSVWHQRFRLLRVDAFNRKRLRSIARELDFSSRTEIKKRGFPDTPEQIRSALKLSGDTHGVIFIARRGKGHVMAFGLRIED